MFSITKTKNEMPQIKLFPRPKPNENLPRPTLEIIVKLYEVS